MFVRVFDNHNDRYYKSIVYCVIVYDNSRKFIVLNPYENCFELVGEDNTLNQELLIDYIRYDTDDWSIYKGAELLYFENFCKKYNKFFNTELIWGYNDVCENFEFLVKILENKCIPIKDTRITIRHNVKDDGWNYIVTQKDADELMQLFAGFHDASLKKLVFEENKGMSSAIAIFDNSIWYGVIEVCFEQVIAINIRPASYVMGPDIYEATLIVKDETVFWADDYLENEDLSYNGTYIKAFTMKWRKSDN